MEGCVKQLSIMHIYAHKTEPSSPSTLPSFITPIQMSNTEGQHGGLRYDRLIRFENSPMGSAAEGFFLPVDTTC